MDDHGFGAAWLLVAAFGFGILLGFYAWATSNERSVETSVARALCVERGGEWVSDPEGCYRPLIPVDDPETEVTEC